jgi:hypothetical protein
MAYQTPKIAPSSSISAELRGQVVGRFCLGCGSVYPQHSRRHAGKPMHGKDHVSCPCSHEGRAFAPNETWWEPAVEVLAPEPHKQPIP